MENVFDPAIHKIVAVVADPDHPERGQHRHVTLSELKSDLAALPIPTTQITSINISDATTLRLIILALLAERDGVRGGDKKWHGGKSNFVWPDPKTGEVVEMDVDDFLDLARTQLAAEAGE